MINIQTVKISYDKLLTRLGYLHDKTKNNVKIIISIKENLSLAQKLIIPKFAIAVEKISLYKNLISFENGYEIKSSNVAFLLKKCFKAYGIVATIGNALEKKRDELLKNGEILNAFILDAAGSVAAEEVVIVAMSKIKLQEKKNNNTLTKRYSPGYGDWTLKENKQFLNWIGASYINITLDKSYRMNPEKTVSALIGIKKA
ncbi:MAG: hypothetical protein LBH27_00720 [Endomicrobium sp.]|jgi:hypothetical protein|nr:hypothetical protein [Endomicrobium sp.]